MAAARDSCTVVRGPQARVGSRSLRRRRTPTTCDSGWTTFCCRGLIWADTLAVHFSHLYRSAYVSAYLLSAIAVFIALGGLFFDEQPRCAAGQGDSRRAGTRGNRRDPRDGADRAALALARALARLSCARREPASWPVPGVRQRIRPYPRRAAGGEQREPPWILWYIRATMREIGLPNSQRSTAPISGGS